MAGFLVTGKVMMHCEEVGVNDILHLDIILLEALGNSQRLRRLFCMRERILAWSMSWVVSGTPPTDLRVSKGDLGACSTSTIHFTPSHGFARHHRSMQI